MKVLFLCTGNSARSQMAEGLAREMGWDAYSAGTEPKSSVHPFAIAVMKEKGIDISHQQPKTIDLNLANSVDLIVTVCDQAQEACVHLPLKVPTLHWSLPDPAAFVGDDESKIQFFRQVRDDLERRIRELPQHL
ncbi:MAG: arsenate reductase ArsC [Armatimonadetes bacterium]|nr:arsenate reductase ArsC [Armatimonadota bacterium]MDW8121916.1 arsenate reductase ArsC [Armatimonadota bacterium]